LKRVLLALLLLFIGSAAVADDRPSITTLLHAVTQQPDLKASELDVRSAEISLKQARAELYPSLAAFGSYTLYNSPTNLRPMPPTEVDTTAGESIPFSKNILRYGLKTQMPLFVKSIYSLAEKVKELHKASSAGHKLKLITRQAAVVSLDASLVFVSHLDTAMASRIDSLIKTRDDLQLAVNNGRTPEAELLKVETSLNNLQKQRNDLHLQAITLTSQLQQLTGIHLDHFVTLTLKQPVVAGEYLRARQQQAKVAASAKELQQAWDQHYPSLKLEGVISENDGEAYNTGNSINRSYNYIGVALSIPLFDRTLDSSIEQAQVQLHRQQQQLAQLRIDLAAQAESLQRQLPIIMHSTELAQTSLENAHRLLDIAKVAFSSGRMSTEEYLRFETQVLDAEAALYKTNVDRWQIISQQALLYGVDLTGVVQ
jgi:outer membrane protein TolC